MVWGVQDISPDLASAPTGAAASLVLPQPSTLNPQPSTLNPQPSTLNPQPSTLNPQPPTLQELLFVPPKPSTVNLGLEAIVSYR